MTNGPRWIMTYMLLMSAFKIGNPVGALIQMIINDFTWNSWHLCLQRFHGYTSGHSILFPASGYYATVG